MSRTKWILIPFYSLEAGDKFRSNNEIFVKIEGPASGELTYAVSLKTYLMKYFYPNIQVEIQDE